jgi:hypothetical protein
MANEANINDVLEGHVALEIECVDRLLLNVYLPALQVGGPVVRFLCGHLGHAIPSTALMGRIGTPVPWRGEGVRGAARDPHLGVGRTRGV